LGVENFKGSQGWIDRFKKRHSVVFKTVQGEAGDVDMASLSTWQQDVLQKELLKWKEDDVYNADETAIFWQLLPNKTLTFKGKKVNNTLILY
jgi:hypothetical protein